MKAERKHELETNDLENGLVQLGEWFQKNIAVVGIVAGIVVVAAFAYMFVFAEKANDSPAGEWNDFFLARTHEDADKQLELFVDAAGSKKTAAPVEWATLSLADLKLALGSQLLFEDRAKAKVALEEANKNYTEVAETGKVPLLVNRARFGLAETLVAQNKIDEAVKQYELVVKAEKESGLGKAALKAQKRLASKDNREMLEWFAKQEPAKKPLTPFEPFDPSATLPEKRPNFEFPELPNTPAVPEASSFPNSPLNKKEETKSPLDDFKFKDEEKEATPEKPAEEKAPAEKPAEEKPAEEK